MKIAIISTFMGQKSGGAEISAYYLALILQKNKIDVFGITSKITKKIPFPCYSLELNKIPNNILMIGNDVINLLIENKFRKIFIREKPDIIHIQDFSMLPSLIKVAKELNIPTVMSVRDFRHQCNLSVCANSGEFQYDCSKIQYLKCLEKSLLEKTMISKPLSVILFPLFYRQRELFRSSIKQVDSLIAVSKFVSNCLVRSGISPSKIDVIYVPKSQITIKIPKLKRKEIVFFTGGLFVKAKGFHNVINAFAQIRKTNTNVKLRIAGDGPYDKELKKLVDKLKLNSSIKFLGKLSPEQMQKEYYNSNLVIQSSIIPESLSRVVIEALSFKKPLICADSGGNKEFVIDEKTGYLVKKKNDFQEYAKKMIEFLKNMKKGNQLGVEGYKLINKSCSDKVVLDKHLEKFNKTIREFNIRK